MGEFARQMGRDFVQYSTVLTFNNSTHPGSPLGPSPTSRREVSAPPLLAGLPFHIAVCQRWRRSGDGPHVGSLPSFSLGRPRNAGPRAHLWVTVSARGEVGWGCLTFQYLFNLRCHCLGFLNGEHACFHLTTKRITAFQNFKIPFGLLGVVALRLGGGGEHHP